MEIVVCLSSQNLSGLGLLCFFKPPSLQPSTLISLDYLISFPVQVVWSVCVV